MCQCPYSGYFLFYPILFGKKPYFPSLPSVFIFSALFHKFLAYMAYIGTFLHLHNLNKAISHIFSKNYFDFLFAPLLSCTFFSCQGFKIAQTLQTTLDRTFLCKSLPITSGNFSVAVLLSQFWCSHGSPESCKEMRHSYKLVTMLITVQPGSFIKCQNMQIANTISFGWSLSSCRASARQKRLYKLHLTCQQSRTICTIISARLNCYPCYNPQFPQWFQLRLRQYIITPQAMYCATFLSHCHFQFTILLFFRQV